MKGQTTRKVQFFLTPNDTYDFDTTYQRITLTTRFIYCYMYTAPGADKPLSSHHRHDEF
ncbi:hypothetical protein YERSI8AC_80009 [Enterobacterales bacterium 8AC]|nr:hypothetical protein YERSI8AC_80009 [Enterobacterales bacterium 8AC]